MSDLPDFDKLWNYNKPGDTEVEFRKLIPLAESSGNISYHIQLLTQIGRTLGLQRKFEEAHQILDKAESMLTDNLPVAKIRLLLERGRAFNTSGRKPEAEKLFKQAWEYGMNNQLDYFAVDAAHMMGHIYAGQGKAEDKLTWEEKALAYAEKSKSEKAKKWLGSLYNNIGWSYHEMQRYEVAKSMFKKCLNWQLDNNRETGAKIAKWSIAKMERLLGYPEKALKTQLDLLDADKGDDPYGYTFEEIAECYLALRQSEKAAVYAKKAWEKLSKDLWLMENEPERVKRLKEIGER